MTDDLKLVERLRAAADALDIKNEKRDEKRLRDLRVRRDALDAEIRALEEKANG